MSNDPIESNHPLPDDLEGETSLPHDIEAERSVIGAVLLESEAIEDAAEILQGGEFYVAAHNVIFRAMLDLADDGEPIDIVTLTARLKDKQQLEEVGGVGYLTQLAQAVPTAANVAYYADIVAKHAVHRQYIAESKIFAKQIRSTDDYEKLVAKTQLRMDAISEKAATKKQAFKHIGSVAQAAFENLERTYNAKSDGGITGIASGFNDLDKMTAGFQKSDFIIVAARPSVGKTAWALNVAQNVAIRKKETVAIFSLEMGAEQLVNRMICAEGDVDAGRMRTGRLLEDDWAKVTGAISTLAEANIFIDDSPAITVQEIRTKCRRLKKEKGLGMILIDYLQLIASRGRRENRQQEVSEISRTLKQIARELEVPVIALSQLSRAVEQRQDKRPMMSDLRESGSLEQDADIVAFLYRDDYYDKTSEAKGIIEIILAKQRNGPTGTVELAFLKEFNKFVNLDRKHEEASPPARQRKDDEDGDKWRGDWRPR